MSDIKQKIFMPNQGEAEGFVFKIEKVISHTIEIPNELLRQLQWCTEDEIDVTITDICFDWGESQGLILRNLSKEKRGLDK